jgi:hypothetical protein
MPQIFRFFRGFRKIEKRDYRSRYFCPSVIIEQICSHWADFCEISYLNIFRNCRETSRFLKIWQE